MIDTTIPDNRCESHRRSNSVGALVQRLQHCQGGHKAFQRLGKRPSRPYPLWAANRPKIGFQLRVESGFPDSSDLSFARLNPPPERRDLHFKLGHLNE